MKKRSEYTPEELAELEKSGIGVHPDGRRIFGYKHGTPEGDYTLTMADARDPVKYQAAREAAAKDGKLPQIVPDTPVSEIALDSAKPNFTPAEPVRITRAQALDAAIYQSAKAKAAELGVALEFVDDSV